ncbi:MAG: efflux RND transporter periplasmic adaptor subunit [Aromatoleum sp.]|uniref:efflux RND transporter periplasmic adaptor subunit n=1 Tax=Aromatoleum sp. TaxID=2307007 RepID=UPI0028953B51|nr:efflux RND transporter periplasmic adaptor subunit [Aromatoleum sp.]MDT3671444.1 efflux RND transporter periplasmic adaptor subunit [Aromatoleum sp.]
MKKAGALLFASAWIVAGTACSPPPTGEKAPRTVLVHTVAQAMAVPTLNVYTGDVRARHETDLAFRIGGKIVERSVDVGERVRRGDVLARLDPQDVRLAANAAASRVAAAEADLALARAELERGQSLRGRNFISESALDTRRTTMQAAAARLRQARAEAASAGNQTEYASLAADRDGVVVATPAEAGEVVAAGQAVARVARLDEREVSINVPESRVAAIAVGSGATVRLWSAPQREYAGTVREIAPAADPTTRSYAVRVSVPHADAALSLGATATVAFAAPSDVQAVLPLPALTRIDGQPVVWIVDDRSTVHPVRVEPGEFREGGVGIRGGLSAGVRVVVAGVHRLVEGETVRAVDTAAPVSLDVSR